MAVQGIVRLLQAAISASRGGNVVVGENALSSAAVLSSYLVPGHNAPRIVIEGAKLLDSPAEPPSIIGRSSILGTPNLIVRLGCFEDSGAGAGRIYWKMMITGFPLAWRLTSWISHISGSWCPDPDSKFASEIGTSVLERLPIDDIQLILATRDDQPKQDEEFRFYRVRGGLNVRGNLSLKDAKLDSAIMNAIQTVADQPDQPLRIAGTVMVRDQAVPVIDLGAELTPKSAPLKVASFTLEKPFLWIRTVDEPAIGQMFTELSLAATCSVGQPKKMDLTLTAMLVENMEEIVFTAASENRTFNLGNTLQDLASLVDAKVTDTTLPGFIEISQLYLRRATLGVSLRALPPVPNYADVTLALPGPITSPITGLKVGDVEFTIESNLAGGWSGFVLVRLDLGKNAEVQLDLMAEFPDVSFYGELDPDMPPLALTELLSAVVNVQDLPSIELAALYFSYKPGRSTYSFGGALRSDWTIPLGDVMAFQIKEVSFDLLGALGQNGKTSGSIGGRASIGSVGFDARYEFPSSDFELAAKIPEIRLGEFFASLGRQKPDLSNGFDFTLRNSDISITKSGADYHFLLATSLDEYGAFRLELLKSSNAGWGVVASVALSFSPSNDDLVNDDLAVLANVYQKLLEILASEDQRAKTPQRDMPAWIEHARTLRQDYNKYAMRFPTALVQLDTNPNMIVTPEYGKILIAATAQEVRKRQAGTNLALLPALQFLQLPTLWLDNAMLVLSSVPLPPGYAFPPAPRRSSTLPAPGLRLPPSFTSPGKGIIVFGEFHFGKRDAIDHAGLAGLYDTCHVPQTIVAAMLQISPADRKLAFAAAVQFDVSGIPVSGTLGVNFSDRGIDVYVEGQCFLDYDNGQFAPHAAGNNPVIFTVKFDIEENGLQAAGSMAGTLPNAFGFKGLTLSNLGLAIGVDWEGIPLVGLAGEITKGRFDGSLACLLNSVAPADSVLAGSLSNITLLDVVEVVAKGGDGGLEVLKSVAITGTDAFYIPGDLADDLDKQDFDKVSAALRSAPGGVSLSGSATTQIIVGKRRKAWFITDLQGGRATHYQLKKQRDDQIKVSTEAQLLIVPGSNAKIAGLSFQQGFFVSGRLKLFGWAVQSQIWISREPPGIYAEEQMKAIDVGPLTLRRGTAAAAGARELDGPYLSLSTFSRNGKPPHFELSGELVLLGLTVSLTVSVETRGLAFNTACGVGLAELKLKGTFTTARLAVGGGVFVGFENGFDLPVLGHFDLKISVRGNIEIGFDQAHGLIARLTDLRAKFLSFSASLPELNFVSFLGIQDLIWEAAKEAIGGFFVKNADAYLQGVAAGTIELDPHLGLGLGRPEQPGEVERGAGPPPNPAAVGRILRQAYGMNADEVELKTRKYLHYGEAEVAAAVAGAGLVVR